MKKITLILLISLLSANLIFSMEESTNLDSSGELKKEVKEQIHALVVHIGSIMDKYNNLEEMINAVADDFKNSYLNSFQRDLYTRVFKKYAKLKYASNFDNSEKVDTDKLSDPDEREKLIKLVLVSEQPNFPVIRIIDEHILVRAEFTTLFHKLVKNNEQTLVKLLIICGIYINTKAQDGITPLTVAENNDNSQMVDLLIEFGANNNF